MDLLSAMTAHGQGYADARGYAGDFRDRPGTIAIGPGEARAFRMTVSVIDP